MTELNVFYRGKNWAIDASQEDGSLGRLINHAPPERFPNCEVRKSHPSELPSLFFYASVDIEEGEELYYDYGDRSEEAIRHNPWLKHVQVGICYCFSPSI